jgi:aryl-alcohol dehydrogenase-like predicted oxidoreductase
MSSHLSMRQLGPFQVTAIGLGCMNLSHAYGIPPSEADANRLLQEAFDLGITHFDSAALYGLGHNETLLGKEFLKKHRQQITLISKGGVGPCEGKRVIDSHPSSLRRDIEGSLSRLQTDVIDLYYLHRWDKKTPIEDVIGTMGDFVKEGKVRAIGMSEISAQTLRKAHAIFPITALQTEYSMWTRNPEIALLNTCRELGIAFVAFSPLGRGYFSQSPLAIAQLPEKDIRRGMPRFQHENFEKNIAFYHALKAIAISNDCSLAQLAIAWVLHQGQDILAIPGTANLAHLRENVAADAIHLSRETLDDIAHILETMPVSGNRYNPVSQSEVDTEQFAS